MDQRVKSPPDWDAAVLRNLPADARYLVGVSGGRDSVALLHWLQARGYSRLIVCHLEHGLRGSAGRSDARFVEGLAARANLPFESKSEDVKTRAAKSKCSIETAARVARYDFFAKVARRRRCSTIFLGHHADDLVETFLINLFRGTGAAGFASLREVSTHRVGSIELTVIRPLLAVWRREIDRFIQSHEIEFREDASNQNLDPLRNRMRHRIIPYLEKIFGREIRRSVWRAATIAAEENAWMAGLLPDSQEELPVAPLRAQPVAVQRRVVHAWLRQHAVADLGFDLIERVRALLAPDAISAKTNLPRGRHVRRRAKKLFIDG